MRGGGISKYEKVFIAKVFTDTQVPKEVLEMENVEYGGTGFYFDKTKPLPYEIEHHFPDYHLYDKFIQEKIASGINPKEFKGYTDYSIGYLTRGCFRKCSFCVNQKYDCVIPHSPLSEFLEPTRPKICLLDDNVFGFPQWEDLFKELIATNKPFQFKQGLDERLLTDKKCKTLCSAKYDGSIIFAFDNIKDYDLIETKLQMIRQYTNKQFTFYVLVAYDRQEEWGKEFWAKDIEDAFTRIALLAKYKCIPYIMRFNKYLDSPYRGLYITLARWANQPNFFKKKSLKEFAIANAEANSKSALRYLSEFEADYPELATKLFNWKWENN